MGHDKCEQRFESVARGFAFFGLWLQPWDHCVNKPKLACWNGDGAENGGAPDKHVNETILDQAAPFEPLSHLAKWVTP